MLDLSNETDIRTILLFKKIGFQILYFFSFPWGFYPPGLFAALILAGFTFPEFHLHLTFP